MGSRGKEQRAGLGCQGSEGSAALAGSQPHPDVVGGQRDLVESPCFSWTLTGWVPFSGTLQNRSKQRFPPKWVQVDFSLYLARGQGLSVWKRNC